MIRAVLDLNVMVSALISPRGAPGRIIARWRRGAFVLVLSAPMLQTLRGVLSTPRLRRQFIDSRDAEHLVHDLGVLAAGVPGDVMVTGVARDPDDDMVLTAAVEGGADYIVTGDDDLLALGNYEGIPIVTPAAFVGIVRAG